MSILTDAVLACSAGWVEFSVNAKWVVKFAEGPEDYKKYLFIAEAVDSHR